MQDQFKRSNIQIKKNTEKANNDNRTEELSKIIPKNSPLTKLMFRNMIYQIERATVCPVRVRDSILTTMRNSR